MIKPILYERIEQKNEIERELFSKLTPEERRAIAKSWTGLISLINHPNQSNTVVNKINSESQEPNSN